MNQDKDINRRTAAFCCIMFAIIFLGVSVNVREVMDFKCKVKFCLNKSEKGSAYCAVHKPTPTPTPVIIPTSTPTPSYTAVPSYTPMPSSSSSYKGSSSSSSSSYKGSSSSSSSLYKSNSSSKGKSSSKSSPYKSYDEGYDAIYDDDDYDDERYKHDKDYANGVDDALDEREERDDW